MSAPNIPERTREEAINDIIESIALEETALAHLINAEAHKVQNAISTDNISIPELTALNKSVRDLMMIVVKKEMLLQFKLELVLTSSPSPCSPRGRCPYFKKRPKKRPPCPPPGPLMDSQAPYRPPVPPHLYSNHHGDAAEVPTANYSPKPPSSQRRNKTPSHMNEVFQPESYPSPESRNISSTYPVHYSGTSAKPGNPSTPPSDMKNKLLRRKKRR
ncbi:hypothetical protein [Heliobacterium chlorum]|uniref:hypothetical protein n=1 Tax=Heliobacterium chlorum TaxID=2698 RepID=UPI001A9BD9F9|nr:hypothetical protein [Heliobacterium chlorum]